MTRAPAGWALALLLPACGSEKTPAALVVAVDGLRAGALAAAGEQHAPNLARLAREGAELGDVVTASTSLPASLASLLTGLPPDRHGLRSIACIGRHRLPDTHETLPERLAARGWATRAVLARGWLAGRLTGLDQGFGGYETPEVLAPDASPDPIGARNVVERAARELGRVEPGAPLFLLAHLADLEEPGVPATPEAARLVRASLEPFARRDPELAAVLDRLGHDPSAVAQVESLLGRRRGDAAWRALVEAAYLARLRAVDAAVGELVALLERDHEPVLVLVVGTRGRYLAEPRPDGHLEGVSEALIAVGAVVAGRAFRERPLPPAGLVTSGLGVWIAAALLDESLGDGLDEAGAPRARRIDSPRAGVGAAVTGGFEIVEDPDGGEPRIVRRASSGDAMGEAGQELGREEELSPDEASQVELLRASLSTWPRPALRVEDLGAGARLEVEVLSPAGKLRPASRSSTTGEGLVGARSWRPTRVHVEGGSGLRVELADAGAAVSLRLSREGAAPAESEVLIAGRTLAEMAIPRLPDEEARPWSEAAGAPAAEVRRSGGGWLAVEVPGGSGETAKAGTALVFAAVRGGPPGAAARSELQVRLEGDARRVGDPVLPGAAVVSGRTPFRADFRPGPLAELALAVAVDGSFVPAARIRYLGAPMAEQNLVILLPSWLPARSDWFAETQLAGEAPSPAAGSATIRIEREDPAPPMEGPLGLTEREVRLLRRLETRE